MTAPYAELQVTSNFSFLRGASHPEELVLRAAELGHRAVAIADRNSLAGVVRAHVAAREVGIRLAVGARLELRDGTSLLCFPTDRAAYGRLSRLISLGRRRAPKGECWLDDIDLDEHADGQVLLAVPPDHPDRGFRDRLADWRRRFRHLFLAASHLYRGDDGKRLKRLADLAEAVATPLVATNDVHYHAPERRRLQDVLACVREGCTMGEAGWRLFAHAERHLKPPGEMARLFRHHPDAVGRSVAVADLCGFSLDELRYEYPDETAPDGRPPQEVLETLTRAGAAERYPGGVPGKVEAQIRHELALIAQLGYAPYFLTVHDIVRFARSRGILCQGRGSAANSTVCYCLGITAVDPAQFDLLFERFVSTARNEPPDIDVDFEHERREEVMQYIYAKYGRERAGLAATVIRYRARGAIRDVGKVLGLSQDVVQRLSGSVWGWGSSGLDPDQAREAGLDPADPTLGLALDLSRELIGFPRHLSQHVGGFVITRGRLDEVVPIENAAMEDRTVIEWDKDDIEALGILKIDVLALGMLSCIRRAFEMLHRCKGLPLELATVPRECPRVYDMLCKADSIGVFQVESRAQMSMLPRLKPRKFYDLVIEVAIVRPGPIQGDMVHPYLRRRQKKEAVDYPKPELQAVLEKTLGVPLFQEQAMKIAMVAAGFTAEEADGLRRAMATFRHNGRIHQFREKFLRGMEANGYTADFAARCFKQLEGFGNYGFPESHAASFAHLVYVSAWLKCHHPDVFAAALLNSQPMGFYAPAQIVRDAQEHGVEVRPPDVNASGWDCTLEERATGGHALRLGLRQVRGLSQLDADRLVRARSAGYPDVPGLWRRSGLSAAVLTRLAEADAFRSLGLDRRRAAWAVRGIGDAPLPLFAGLDAETPPEPEATLPSMTTGEHVAQDYVTTSLSLKAHPLELVRNRLPPGIVPCGDLSRSRNRSRLAVAGLVLLRQKPGTASGVIFMTLEDETGVANLVLYPRVFESFRAVALRSRLLVAHGRLEKVDEVIHLLVERLEDRTDLLAALRSGDDPGPLAATPRHPRDHARAMWRSRDFK